MFNCFSYTDSSGERKQPITYLLSIFYQGQAWERMKLMASYFDPCSDPSIICMSYSVKVQLYDA